MKIKPFFVFIVFFAFSSPALTASSFSKARQNNRQTSQKPNGTANRQSQTIRTASSTATSSSVQGQRRRTSSTSTSSGRDPEYSNSSATLPPEGSEYYYTGRLDILTPAKRQELDKKHLSALCHNRYGNVSCGYREQWSHRGDPYFTWDPYMNRIKRQTPINVEIKCDPKKKLFYTNVYICPKRDGNNCPKNQRKYFVNPYATCRVKSNGLEECLPDYVSSRELFSRKPQNWMTSPGIYLPQSWHGHAKLAETYRNYQSPTTNLPNVISRTEGGNDEIKLVAQDQKVASAASLYEGYPTPNIIWLNRNGNAIHGSEYVDGRPRSQGCLRLHQKNAIALYRLARRVGTKNFTVRWGEPPKDMGYGPIDPKTGRPACAGSKEQNEKLALNAYKRFANYGSQASADLVEAFEELMKTEGRIRIANTDTRLEQRQDETQTNQ